MIYYSVFGQIWQGGLANPAEKRLVCLIEGGSFMASSTREKILAVSLRLFNEQGYRNVAGAD